MGNGVLFPLSSKDFTPLPFLIIMNAYDKEI